MVIGAQNILGGFLMAIVNGNDAEFIRLASSPPPAIPVQASASPARSRTKPLDGRTIRTGSTTMRC